jgi:hypothetical protein
VGPVNVDQVNGQRSMLIGPDLGSSGPVRAGLGRPRPGHVSRCEPGHVVVWASTGLGSTDGRCMVDKAEAAYEPTTWFMVEQVHLSSLSLHSGWTKSSEHPPHTLYLLCYGR